MLNVMNADMHESSKRHGGQMSNINRLNVASVLVSTLLGSICAASVYPHTDPTNSEYWVLVPEVSDEFQSPALDENKWHIQGTDGFYYSNFIGRAPSQFSTDNVRVENGKLKIQTKWDPNFNFSTQPGQGGVMYENITTAAVISKQTVQYGYMEIMAKAADTSISSAFWMTGGNAEVDVFEHFGNPSLAGKSHLETEMWSSVHDWTLPREDKVVWTERTQLPFRVADGFHIYAADWTENGIKFYADGQLIHEVMAADIPNWPVNDPLRIWVDSETFWWHGLPDENSLPADYEIEYIRVWQRGSIPGDLDGDGFIGIIDMNIILSVWNSDGSLDPRADINGDGYVGIDDLNTVLGNWNAGTPPSIHDDIPEPSTLLLVLISGVIVICRLGRVRQVSA